MLVKCPSTSIGNANSIEMYNLLIYFKYLPLLQSDKASPFLQLLVLTKDEVFLFGCSLLLDIYLISGKKKSNSDGSDSGEENLSKKDLALKHALDQITTSFGKGSIMWLGRTESPKQVPVVSTGSFSLDIALGIGGLPKVKA